MTMFCLDCHVPLKRDSMCSMSARAFVTIWGFQVQRGHGNPIEQHPKEKVTHTHKIIQLHHLKSYIYIDDHGILIYIVPVW